MRTCVAVFVFSCLLPTVASAQRDNKETESEAVERYTQILNAKSKIDVIELPFSQVLSDLSKKHGIPITLDADGLKEVGASPRTLITYLTKEIPLRTALTAVLKPYRLTFAVTPTGLVITAEPKPAK